MDIDELAKKVFSEPPKETNSIQIGFDNLKNVRELFEALLMLFTEGMKILYGNNGQVNLDNLTIEDHMKVTRYFSSIGINIYLHKFHISQIGELETKLLRIQKADPNLSVSYNTQNHISKDLFERTYFETPTPDMIIKFTDVHSGELIDYKHQLRVGDNVYVIYFGLNN